MKLTKVREKYGTNLLGLQVESYISHGLAMATAGALLTVCITITGRASAQASAGQSTSPLEILKQAPKVHIEDPAITPMPAAPIPYAPPRGPAPAIQPVEPAITPYNGNSVSGSSAGRPDYLNYGGPVASPPPMATPGMVPRAPYASPTPRPVLGPEDVEKRKPKKKGFVRGLINAIPFVGGDDEDEATPTPTPLVGRTYERAPVSPSEETPAYRGYEPTPAAVAPGRTLLMPPDSASGRENLPGEPEPSSPPILTPTPRGGLPGPDNSNSAVSDPAGVRHDAAMDSSAPVLTVKRESDTTTATSEAPVEPESSVTPSATATPETIKITPKPKQPSVSGSLDDNVSAPVQSESVVIQDSRPKAPEPTGIILEATVPQTPGTNITTETATADTVTSLVIEQADLGMPNPTYEQNTSILGEFQAGVRRARTEDYAAAAQLFREYGANHPSSGLAPRALFLAVIFEKNIAASRESLAALKKQFPDSHYVADAEKRRPEIAEKLVAAASTPAIAETPRQKVDRLEKELTVAVGDSAKEPQLRLQLGAAYVDLEEFDRAWEVLNPALEMLSGQPAEGDVLLLLARCQMGRHDTARALAIVEVVESKYPNAIMNNAETAWNSGLAFESGGRYIKARTIYNELRLKWPAAPEARWAETRLRDLAVLAQ